MGLETDSASGLRNGPVVVRAPSRSWPQKVLIVAIILAGPIFSWLIAIDGTGTGFGNFGLFVLMPAAFTLGLALLLRLPQRFGGLIRIVLALAVGSLVFFAVLIALYLFMTWAGLAGFKTHRHPGNEIAALLSMVGATLAGTAIWRLIQKTGLRWSLELGALLAAALPPITIYAFRSHGDGPLLLGDWWIFLAFVPLIGLALRNAPRFSTGSLIAILLATALPLYALKATDDAVRGVATPLLWPYRVVTSTMPPLERIRFERDLERVTEGETVRLGERWYVFAGASGTGAARPGTRPDRLISLQLRARTTELGLPEPPERPGVPAGILRIGFNAEAGTRQTQYVVATYEDLAIYIEMPDMPDWPSEEIVRQQVLEYLRQSEVAAPQP